MSKSLALGIGIGIVLAGVAGYGAIALWPQVHSLIQVEDAKPAISAEELSRIAPHKALYRIEMVQKRSGSQLLNISGDMFFEWKPGCDAWTTDHRFQLRYEYPDSPPMRITSDFTTYERFNGDGFDFNSRRRRDGELYEELRGRATHDADGGRAIFSIPAGLTFDLPQGTLFPMAHSLAVLRAARAGQKFFNATIFDGSDGDGPIDVNAFIGKVVDATTIVAASPAIDATLIQSPAWNVRLAFFPLASDEPESDYEMSIVMHDNGVISDMYVDYKDFAVTQRLIGLESVKREDCTAAQSPHPR